MLQAGFENKVMHATLRVAEIRIMASDGGDDKSKFDGFRLALADAGSILMPLCNTFWSPCYGMVTDKFNVGWMVMVPGDSPA